MLQRRWPTQLPETASRVCVKSQDSVILTLVYL